MRKGPLALALAAPLAIALAAGPACTDHTCEAGPATLLNGVDPNTGELVAEDTWESTAIDADWIAYPENAVIVVQIPRWIQEKRPIVEMHVYLSFVSHPATTGNFAEGSGNATEFINASAGTVTVVNATCSSNYARIVLRGGRPLVDAGPFDVDDAGADPRSLDGGTDAGLIADGAATGE